MSLKSFGLIKTSAEIITMAQEIKRNINLIGFQKIDSFEKHKILQHASIVYDKINTKTKNINSMNIHLKQYSKTGTKQKFSIHSKIRIAGISINAKHTDWNLGKTVLKTLKEIEKELRKKFKKIDKKPKHRTKKSML